MKKTYDEIKNILIIFIAAAISYVSIYVFVLPSEFSPSGVDGISTILYELTNINMGWFKLFINVPLLILAWVFLNKRYVFYVIAFTLLDAFGVIFLEEINFYTFIPSGLTAGDRKSTV